MGEKLGRALKEEEIIPVLEVSLPTIRPEVTEVRPQALECDVVRFQNNKEK